MWKLLFLCLFFNSQNVFAGPDIFENTYALYRDGKYIQAIEALNALSPKEEKQIALKEYWSGLCYSKLQQFDKAAVNYKLALRDKGTFEDLYFMLGQALYAMNEMESARKSFALSALKSHYKEDASYYYVGHISQILEEHENAKKYFGKVLSTKTEDKNLTQVAKFQIAESNYTLNEEKTDIRNTVKRLIIPQLKAALKVDKESEVAKEIQNRIDELTKKYALDPNMMLNGREISKKRYSFYVSQKIKYDSNVTLANDQTTTVASLKDSYVFDTAAYGKYTFPIKQKYLIEPELKFTNTKYSDQDSATVYQNDAFSIVYGLHNKYEHKFREKPASTLLEYDQNYTDRDRDLKHDRIYYSRAHSYMLGEKLSLFGNDETTLKFRYKKYTAYLATISSETSSFVIDHMSITQKGNVLLYFFSADDTTVTLTPNNSTKTYTFRLDYIIPNILNTYTLGLNYTYLLLDTLLQQETRGTEKTSTPAFTISRNFDNLKAEIGYSYTDNTSLSETFSYEKHETHFELKYSF